MRDRTLIPLLALLAVGGFSPAQAIQPELISPLNPRAKYYQENATRIDALGATATNAAAPAQDRLAALRDLQQSFRYAAVPNAARLIGDRQLELAELSAQILANAVVMSDHSHVDHGVPASLAMQQHEIAKEALRKAVLDPRPSVREIATPVLTSLSDKQTHELIDTGVQRGLYSPVQAVNLHGLGNPDVSAEHIARYLTGPNANAQAAAISYLGANPRYQTTIRERYLEAANAPDVARTAAAQTLSRYDRNFHTYAERTLQNTTLPPAAFEIIAKSYVARPSDRSSAVKVQTVDELTKGYLRANPNADLTTLQRQMQQLKL